jgi:hypothetical protein
MLQYKMFRPSQFCTEYRVVTRFESAWLHPYHTTQGILITALSIILVATDKGRQAAGAAYPRLYIQS